MNTTTTLRISRDLAVGGQQMIAAKHELAVQAGNDILDQGGNAVDAAVAVGFAIGVVEPWMSGIGGVGWYTAGDLASRFWPKRGFAPVTTRLERRVDERVAWAKVRG